MPGFRPGKTPRPVLEARIGKPAVRQQALEDHIPVWYDRAVRDKAVDIITEAGSKSPPARKRRRWRSTPS